MINYRLRFIFVFFLMMFYSIVSAEQQSIIFQGTPVKKVMSQFENTRQIELSKAEMKEYELLISRKDGKYYWASRENKELTYSVSGVFHNFVEPSGSGYIRVTKAEDGCVYMEHLTLALTNITYWGVSEKCFLQE